MSLELLNVGIDSQIILKGIILLIFEKALDEKAYSSLYAQLCHRLCEDAPNFEPADSNITTFRRLLLNKCQDEFENRSRATEAFDKDGPLTPEEEEQLAIAKRKMLGNIKFIGELGKLEMLHEGILHKCIKQLLEKKKRVAVRDIAEDLECLCQIMKTVGRRLDNDRAKAWVDQYFARMNMFMHHRELPSRIRFMLQDIIELRQNRWAPRKINMMDNGPRTIRQVRDEAAKHHNSRDFGSPPSSQRRKEHDRNIFGTRQGNLMMNGMGAGRGGGMADVFASMPGFLGGGDTLGTGPGVIHVDNFGYNNHMGRQRGGQNNHAFPGQFGGNRRMDGGPNQKVFHDRGSQQDRPDRERGDHRDNRDRDNRDRDNRDRDNGDSRDSHDNRDKPDRSYAGRQQKDAGRELPPRFRKMNIPGGLQQQSSTGQNNVAPSLPTDAPLGVKLGRGEGGNQAPPTRSNEEISLRPARNFTPLFKPNTPSMLPKSTQIPNPPPNKQNLLLGGTQEGDRSSPIMTTKQPNIIIKQVPSENKIKVEKKKIPSKEELKTASEALLKLHLEEPDVNKAVEAVRDMNAPKRYMPELVSYLIIETLDKSDEQRANISKLISALKEQTMITAENYMEAFGVLLERMPELEVDVPLIKSHTARFAAQGVTDNIVSLAELAEPMHNGAHYPLFLLCLQQLHKQNDKEWLVKNFNDSKINLQDMLPECDRTKERMMEVLEDRGLSFMFPLLRVQNDLWKQFKADPNPTSIYKWIKENVDQSLFTNAKFINLLISNVIRHIANESTLDPNIDRNVAPDKALLEKEKELLSKFKGMLTLFLQDNTQLQMVALYSLQVFCHNMDFPKGLLLRMFMYLYDMEVIDEEVFLKWKEEVTDEYPGKGKALFQVNQWLMWLEQAEEEESDED